jgi:hypothetical protein
MDSYKMERWQVTTSSHDWQLQDTRKFKHYSNPIVSALDVDDFLVQYSSREDLVHLQTTLRQNYQMMVDIKASKFCGMTLEWNYEEGHATTFMPGYIDKALQRLMYPSPSRLQHSPLAWTAPGCGACVKCADPVFPICG